MLPRNRFVPPQPDNKPSSAHRPAFLSFSLSLFPYSLPRRDDYIYDFIDYYIHDPSILELFNH